MKKMYSNKWGFLQWWPKTVCTPWYSNISNWEVSPKNPLSNVECYEFGWDIKVGCGGVGVRQQGLHTPLQPKYSVL